MSRIIEQLIGHWLSSKVGAGALVVGILTFVALWFLHYVFGCFRKRQLLSGTMCLLVGLGALALTVWPDWGAANIAGGFALGLINYLIIIFVPGLKRS